MSTSGRSPGQAPSARPSEPELYTLEIVVELSGVPMETILQYQEHGLLDAAPEPEAKFPRFDDESLRTLRQIEHLKARYGMNLAGVKLLLRLLAETERLERELRARR